MALIPLDSGLPEDQQVLIGTVRDYAREALHPLDRAWDAGNGSVIDVLPSLGEMGLMTLCIPESLGGVGCSYRTYAAIIHELSVWSPSTSVTVAVHNMVGRILAKAVSEPLRSTVLSKWHEPGNLSAFAQSEANAGSDAAAVRTTVERVPGGFQVTGEKMWITNGLHSRWFLTLVRLVGASDSESLCALLIDGNDSAIARTEITGKLGIRGSETAVIHFSNLFVPESNLIGEIGQGLQVCLSTLNEGRIGIAAQASGIAEACLTEMTAYAGQREQFGRRIGGFPAVAEMIADSAVELDASKILVWRAASLVDAGRSDRAASSMAKLYASECANRVAYRAVQVHGGMGFVHECRVEQLYRDARVTTIYEGTSEIQRLVIARELGA